MASDASHLILDDIIMPLDPQLDARQPIEIGDAHVLDRHSLTRSNSPDPPDEHEVLAMRARALSIRNEKITENGKGGKDEFQDELVDMVLRLSAGVPSRAQVHEQANTIRRLSLQQGILLKRMSDECESWEAERDGMRRVCEALIAQANIASHNLYKEQEISKKPTNIESENASLRQKLADAQTRVSSLEVELAQLRPLLLMQPSAIAQYKGITVQTGKLRKKEGVGLEENRSYYRVREEKVPGSKPRKKKAAAYFKHAPTIADARSEHLLLAARKLGKERATMVSQTMYRPPEPQPPSTSPNHDLTLHIQGRANEVRPIVTSAIWPAAQHIPQPGSQRPGHQQGQQPGSSKTPQNSPFSHFGSPGVTYPQQYFVSGPVSRPGTSMPAPTFYPAPPRGYISGPAWPYYHPGPYRFGQPIAIQNAIPNQSAKTMPTQPSNSPPVAGPSRTPAPRSTQAAPGPSSQDTTKNDQPSNQTKDSSNEDSLERAQKTPRSKSTAQSSASRNPPTPMDSLLSAARSVFSPESSGGSHVDDDGSPSPKKRRRVAQQSRSNTDQPAEKQTTIPDMTATPDRQTSALDVLADQAAGVVPSSQLALSGGVTSEAEVALSTGGRRSEATSGKCEGPRKRNQSVESAKMERSIILVRESTLEADLLASAKQRDKRVARASSTAPDLRTSSSTLAPTITVQRAASEEHTTFVASVPLPGASDSFKLRPVTSEGYDMASAGPSASPQTSVTSWIDNAAVRGRARNPNGCAASSTSVSPPLARVTAGQRRNSATPSVDADADAEGDEVESEDDVDAGAEVDQLKGDSHPRKGNTTRRGKGSTPVPSSSEDANSRRWLEILGRKDS